MSEIAAEVVGSNTPGVDSQSSGADTFSFAALHEQAMNYKPEGTPDAQEQVTGDEGITASAGTEEQAQNVDNASTAQLASLKDTDLVEVTVDGQPVQMPWSEARGGVMRQAKFTKEMQTLAQQREAFQREAGDVSTLRQEREAMVELLKNPNMLRQFVQQKYPDIFQAANQAVEQAANALDPDDIATVGQIEQVKQQAAAAIQGLVEQVKETLARQEEIVTQRIEDRHATAKLSSDVNSTISELFKAHPHVEKVVPNANELLRYEVLKLKPQTPEETLEAFKTVFGGWVENIKSVTTDTNKQTVINKQKLVTNGIQPPGGAGVQPQVTDFKKTNSMTGKVELDWNKIHEAAMASLK